MSDCIICLEPVDSDDEETGSDTPLTADIPCKCIYSIHPECLYEWFRSKYACPMCRIAPVGTVTSLASQDTLGSPRQQLLSAVLSLPRGQARRTNASSGSGGFCAFLTTSACVLFIIWVIVNMEKL
jgi:hypothetical protein